ncbi:hypothetical protein [Leifsonia sp. Leaf336]|uniref:hypothetical protein n=1 Tax=Leifsonia sp. Leaf336 TaxID=1736341 RepID=UPI000A5783D1|nr:hypothetical protein [Leifsonia sp. Leaf336]
MESPKRRGERESLIALAASTARLVELLESREARLDESSARSADARVRASRATDSARPVAAEYLRALADGDTMTANRLGRINADLAANEFLRHEVYSSADHLTDPYILSGELVARDGSDNEVRFQVTYDLAGETIRDAITLLQSGGDWWVSDGLTYRLPRIDAFTSFAAESRFSLRGARIPVDRHGYAGSSVYAGVYTLAPPNAFYDIHGEVTVVINRDSPIVDEGAFTMVPNEGYVSQVQHAVDQAFSEATNHGTLEALREAGMRNEFARSTLLPSEAVVVSMTVLDVPTVSVRPRERRPFAVSEGRALVATGGLNGRGEPVTESVMGTFRYDLETTIVGDEVIVRIAS